MGICGRSVEWAGICHRPNRWMLAKALTHRHDGQRSDHGERVGASDREVLDHLRRSSARMANGRPKHAMPAAINIGRSRLDSASFRRMNTPVPTITTSLTDRAQKLLSGRPCGSSLCSPLGASPSVIHDLTSSIVFAESTTFYHSLVSPSLRSTGPLGRRSLPP